MGTEKALLERLSKYEAAIDSPAKLDELRSDPRRTPASFNFDDLFPNAPKRFGVTANQLALFAANALVDAVALRCLGTDEGRSLMLVEQLFERQVRWGFMCLSESRREFLTSSHGHLWDAAMAAILFVASRQKLESMVPMIAGWWRQRFDLWDAHFVAEPGTILAPCFRGGTSKKPNLAVNESSNAIYKLINYGQRRRFADSNRYMTGARLWQRMENIPLPRPSYPYPLPVPLKFGRYADGFESCIDIEDDGLDLQPLVGTTRRRPKDAVKVPGGWATFGPTRRMLSDGAITEKTWPCIPGLPEPGEDDSENAALLAADPQRGEEDPNHGVETPDQ